MNKFLANWELEPAFGGFEFEEDKALNDFVANFFEELLIDYVFQNKIVVDGKDKEDEIVKGKVQAAKEKLEKVNEMLFYSIIALSQSMCSALKSGGIELSKISSATWDEKTPEQREKLFTNLS